MIKAKDWRYPRDTIAQAYKDNDYGYVFHAGMLFVEFLFASKKTANDLKSCRILDYGCGTGRVSRFLALTGAKVVGYDPTQECIQEAHNEGLKAPPTSLTPELFTSDFSRVGSNFDIVLCINVLPHLSIPDQNTAISNIVLSLKEGGTCFLWIHKDSHLPLVDRDTIKNQSTNVVVVCGTKTNGKIDYYQKCNP